MRHALPVVSTANTETIEVLKLALHEGIVKVVFTKVDGTERTMRCTLSEKLIPKLFKSSQSIPSTKGVIRVYDLDKSAWRSFKVNSIISTELA